MTSQQLKNSILQMAVQGKLVPQNENDEPAGVLLEKIHEEKERLIKDGKIKREKPLPLITDEEKPFDIPDSWRWVRLGAIINLLSGQDFESNKYNDLAQGIPYLTGASNIENGNVIINRWTTSPRCRATKGELLIVCKGAGVGKMAVLQLPEAHIARQLMSIKIIYCLLGFIKTILEYNLSFIRSNMQGVIPGISRADLLQLVIPLPPLAEQQRIVEKIDELQPMISAYEKAYTRLEKINTEFPDKLKKSLLQEAVQGKLVPQNENDEPASALLEKIRAEKERLIKEGKIKKEKPLPPITDEEKPFTIPDSWEWVRLGEIARTELGKTLDKAKNKGELKPYLCSINVYWNGIDLSTVKKARFQDNEISKYILKKGDLLICEGGDVGRTAIWDDDEFMLYQNALHRVRFYGNVNPYYFKLLMECFSGLGILIKKSKGVTIKHLTQTALCSILFPLPPLAEQQRIVECLDSLLPRLGDMKN